MVISDPVPVCREPEVHHSLDGGKEQSAELIRGKAKALRIHVKAPNGIQFARIFEVRC